MTSRSEAEERVAYWLWRKAMPHLTDRKAKETWTWLPAASKRQWIAEAEEVVSIVLYTTEAP